jgi:hypothetical protein
LAENEQHIIHAESENNFKVIFRDDEGLHIYPLEQCYGKVFNGPYTIVKALDYSPEELTEDALRGYVFQDQTV